MGTRPVESGTVVVGDACELLPQLPEDSIDLIVTSPPYWGQRTYGLEHNWQILRAWKATGAAPEQPPAYSWYRTNGGTLGLEPYPEWFIAHVGEILSLGARCLKPSGSLWINVGDTYFARWSSIRDKGRQGLGDEERLRRRTPMGGYRQEKQLLLIPARFAIAMQSRGWILRNDLIWLKPNVPPRPERDRLRLAHEHFFHFVKRPKLGRAKYYYDLRMAEPEANDVVCYSARSGANGHTATFPKPLLRPRILSSCPAEGWVLDPFCGTGRALEVAIECGRKALGFDVLSHFVSASLKVLGPEEKD